jgi:hypothetical protein
MWIVFVAQTTSGQEATQTIAKNHNRDSLYASVDSLIKEVILAQKSLLLSSSDSSYLKGIKGHFKKELKTLIPFQGAVRRTTTPRSAIRSNGFLLDYSTYYNSNVDTPYSQENLAQHNLMFSGGLNIFNTLPVNVSGLFRRTNSPLFRPINDFQISLDVSSFQQQIADKAKTQYLQNLSNIGDSLLKAKWDQERRLLSALQGKFSNRFSYSKYVEANEVVHVRKIAWDYAKNDSLNEIHADSMQRQAAQFIEAYTHLRKITDSISHKADSLKFAFEQAVQKSKQLKAMVEERSFPSIGDFYHFIENESKVSMSSELQSPFMRWARGVRQLAVGKTNVSTSELSAKNVRINGIDYLYNSWFIFGLTAGFIDYRFHDFVVSRNQSRRQYLIQAKLGVGSLDRNYMAVSFVRGRKQLFGLSTPSANQVINFHGVNIESRWMIKNGSYLTAEFGQSFAPDLHQSPIGKPNGLSLGDKSSKAVSVKYIGYLNRFRSRVEAGYKYFGANYQSFNSLQNTNQYRAWWLSLQHSFFSRRLTLSGSLRSNEYTNPFIVQRFKANTVFKTVQASFHSRKLPSISVAFLPMSQFSQSGNTLLENRFQSLQVNASHFYYVGSQPVSTSILLSQYFNHAQDTGYIFFNAKSLFASQTIFFHHFSTSVIINRTVSADYQLNVFEEGLQVTPTNRFNVGGAVKIYNFNSLSTKLGGGLNVLYRWKSATQIYLRIEQGYLPSNHNQLHNNLNGAITFSTFLR